MFLCAAGDNHGAIDRLYAAVLAFEKTLGVRFDHILHVGDFGIWPDPDRIDKATRKHEGAGDFPVWYSERRPVPRSTVFIKGNHEDFVWLDAHPTGEVLEGLRYLKNGDVTRLATDEGSIVVGGIGGCFGPSDYERSSRNLQAYARRHYTRDEVERICKHSRLDILLLHDAPAGVVFTRGLRGGGINRYTSEAPGLGDALECSCPRVCFFGHHHNRVDAKIAGISCVGLNIVGRHGNLVGIEVPVRGRGWSSLGEWPPNDQEESFTAPVQ